MLVVGTAPQMGERCFTGEVTPGRERRDPYESPIVRDRAWLVTFVVFWALVVVLRIAVIVVSLRNHVPLGVRSWLEALFWVVVTGVPALWIARFRRVARRAGRL